MWKAFINDERTRSFLAIEVVSGGSSEVGLAVTVHTIKRSANLLLSLRFYCRFWQIKRQVLLVDEVYKRHNLPTFYKVHQRRSVPHFSGVRCELFPNFGRLVAGPTTTYLPRMGRWRRDGKAQYAGSRVEQACRPEGSTWRVLLMDVTCDQDRV